MVQEIGTSCTIFGRNGFAPILAQAFDTNGNVIGINTAIYPPSGDSVGIGFDIPSQTCFFPKSYPNVSVM